MAERFLSSVTRIVELKPDQGSRFHKYTAQRTKEEKNLLVLKKSENRIKEKKEFEYRVEQEERNKVFRAIEFN